MVESLILVGATDRNGRRARFSRVTDGLPNEPKFYAPAGYGWGPKDPSSGTFAQEPYERAEGTSLGKAASVYDVLYETKC